MIMSAELSAPLRITSGPAIQHAGDLAALLSSLSEGDVLFLDEIHQVARLPRKCSTWRWRTTASMSSSARALAVRWRFHLEIPAFTLVGATTRAGLLDLLRDRFGFTAHMDFYEPAELADPHAISPAARRNPDA